MELFGLLIMLLIVFYSLLIILGTVLQLESPTRRCGIIDSLDNIGLQCYTKFSNNILVLIRLFMKSGIYLGIGIGYLVHFVSAGTVGN